MGPKREPPGRLLADLPVAVAIVAIEVPSHPPGLILRCPTRLARRTREAGGMPRALPERRAWGVRSQAAEGAALDRDEREGVTSAAWVGKVAWAANAECACANSGSWVS